MLIPCPSCGKRLSDRVRVCPFCRASVDRAPVSADSAADSGLAPVASPVSLAAPKAPSSVAARPSIAPPSPGPVAPLDVPTALPAYQRGDFVGDSFQIIQVLGEGGFGIVYLASSLSSRETVALKTLRGELLRDAKTRAMFEKEARIWIDLGAHPNLVRAYQVSEISGRLYIAMEYVKAGAGRPNGLEGYLEKGPIETAQALLWAIQFCRGMEYAVSKGVRCHRDIKPANILIGGDGVVKISDFGIAGLAQTPDPPAGPAAPGGLPSAPAAEDPAKTAVGTVFGTPTHMPPEQFQDAASCDERSDIYSFGVVLYQMASGGRLPYRPPPPPPAAREQAGAYYWHAFRLMHERATEPPLSSPLSAVVTRCLKKKPAERYQGFAELRADLEVLYRQVSGQAAPVQKSVGETAHTWNAKGMSLSALGRFAEAVQCYDKALVLDPNHAALHNNRGNSLRQLGRVEESLHAFDQAISLDPLYPAPWENKALLYATAQRNEEALACIDRALELDPTSGGAWVSKGVLLGRLGRRDEQIAAYDEALRLDPRNGLAWFNKANCLSFESHVAALECLNQSLACDPSYAPAWDLKGTVLEELGLPEEGISCHQEAIRLAPEDWAAHYNLGNGWLALDRLVEAADAFEQATRLNPQFPIAWYNLALTRLRLGQNVSALSVFDHFLSLNPPAGGFRETAERLAGELRAGGSPVLGALSKGKRISPEQKATINPGVLPRVEDPAPRAALVGSPPSTGSGTPEDSEPLPPPRPSVEALNLEAASLFNAGRFKEALALVDGILLIEPRDPKTLNTRANTLFKLGRKDEACAAIDVAVEAMPGQLTFWVNKAFIEKGAGRLPAACRSALDLIEIAQVTDAKVDEVKHARQLIAEAQSRGVSPIARGYLGWLGLGFASMIARRPEMALQFLDRAIQSAPTNVEVLRWKGRALKQEQRADEALAVFDQALSLDPNSVETHHDRGVVLAMLREFGPALEAFDRALALEPDHVPSLSDKGKYAGELGRHEDALRALRRAAALMPDHPAPWLNKALVEDLLNRDEDALQSYERFLKNAQPEMRLQIEASRRKVEQLRARIAARGGVKPLAATAPPTTGPGAPLPQGAPTAASLLAVKNLLAEDDLSDAEIERLARALDQGDSAALQGALQRGRERMAAQVAEWQNSAPGSAAPTAPKAAAASRAALVIPDVSVPATVATASFDDCLKRAEMVRNQGLFDKSVEWADQAIAAEPSKHQGWLSKAEALFGRKRFAEAAAHAKKATEIQPGLAAAWVRLASSLDALNAPELALPAWEKAVELGPSNVLNWNGLGLCLARLGRLDEALAAHDKSLTIDPRFSLGKFYKGMREADLGRRESALKSLQQFLALAPPNLAGLAQQARQRIQELKA